MQSLLRIALVVGLLAVLPAATAQTRDQTLMSEFYPAMEAGKLSGCQIGFSVRRVDNEYNSGRPALVNGLLFYLATSDSFGLRIGVATDGKLEQFRPPEKAYLYANLGSNIDELATSSASPHQGFRVFVFKPGDNTMAALTQLTLKGTVDIGYRMSSMPIDAKFTLNAAANAQAAEDWGKCLLTLADQSR